MNNVFVSIVIPHYNQKDFLVETVDSVLKSTFPYYEIIIVDDCSIEEGARETIKRLAKNNENVSYIFHKENKGLSAARNTGIKNAKGKYILPLDSDDMITPDALMKMYKAQEFLKYNIVSSFTERFGEIGELEKQYQLPTFKLENIARGNTMNYCSMYLKTMWQELGGYDEKMRMGYEDWEFWIRAAKAGKTCFFIPEYLFLYRIRNNSMLSQSKKRHAEIVDYIMLKHPDVYGEGKRELEGTGEKLALLNRNPKLWLGGDVVQIVETAKKLNKYYDCDYIHNTVIDLSQYKKAIIYHCNTEWALGHAKNCVKQGVKYLVNAIFYPHINTNDKVKYVCENSEGIVFFSNKEKEEFNQEFSIDKPQYVIPNGTSSRFHSKNVSGDAVGVLSASPRNDKGEDVIKEICDELKLPYIETSGIDHEDMPEHLRKGKVFVNGSRSERMSLSTGEALCAGLRVIDTVYNRGNEWYGKMVKTDTFNRDEVKKAIKTAYEAEEWDFTPNELARTLTWDKVALEYKKILETL